MGRTIIALNRDAHLAVIKLAAEMEISELYAIQFALNLGLYQLKKIAPEIYDRDKRFWSSKLVAAPQVPERKMSLAEIVDAQKAEETRRWLEGVKADWHLDHRPLTSGKGWREYAVEKAEAWKTKLPKDPKTGKNVADEILDLWSQTYLKVNCDRSA